MSALCRVLRAELLKLHRTLAFWMILIAPAVVLLLTFLMFHERSAFYLKMNHPLWQTIQSNTFSLWCILMLPLYVTLQTALLGTLEHTEGRWRNLLALPVSRPLLYFVKLLIPWAMVTLSSYVLTFGTVCAGLALRTLKPELQFPAPLPWSTATHDALLASVAGLFLAAIHQWASLRFSSFAASVGFGMSATIAGFVVVNSAKYGPWWPWCLGVQFLSKRPGATEQALWYAAIGALVLTIAGTIDFSRREMR